jgi:hypothetical protein
MRKRKRAGLWQTRPAPYNDMTELFGLDPEATVTAHFSSATGKTENGGGVRFELPRPVIDVTPPRPPHPDGNRAQRRARGRARGRRGAARPETPQVVVLPEFELQHRAARVLEIVGELGRGVTVNQVAERLGVGRTEALEAMRTARSLERGGEKR